MTHDPVLLDEAVDALDIRGDRANGIYLDGTFGRGGHSRLILEKLGEKGRLIAFDKDPEAIAVARRIDDPRFEIVHGSFAVLDIVLAEKGIDAIDGVLLDLGISSPQLEDAERGFSFLHDGPLDMRMDPSRGISAREWLAVESEEKIAEVIRQYGEERFAFQILQCAVEGIAHLFVENVGFTIYRFWRGFRAFRGVTTAVARAADRFTEAIKTPAKLPNMIDCIALIHGPRLHASDHRSG